MNTKILSVMASALAWVAAPANATVFTVSYTGTINLGLDATIQNGTQVGGYLFQRPETDLAGLTLAIVLEFDTANATPIISANSIEVTGGDLLGTPAIVTAAYFEINGRRVTLDPSGYGRAYLGSNGTGQYLAFSVRDPITGTSDENELRFDAGNGPGGIYPSYSFDNSFSFTPDLSNGGASGAFRDIHYDANGKVIAVTVGNVYDGTVNLSVVPEPTTWVMMIAGFGVVGGAMRRRRKTSVRTTVAIT